MQLLLGTGLASAALAVSYASAATSTSQVTIALHSVVRALCTVAVVASPQSAAIDLSTSQTNLPIATVTESCNSGNGYSVTVSSQNGSVRGEPAMVGAVSNGAVGYSVLYDGTPVTFSNGSAVAVDLTGTRAPLIRRSVSIGFSGNPDLPSDSYQDTLTFSILGK